MRFCGYQPVMTFPKALYERWINELWAGEPVAAELVSEDFVGHWPDREVHGPDELQPSSRRPATCWPI